MTLRITSGSLNRTQIFACVMNCAGRAELGIDHTRLHGESSVEIFGQKASSKHSRRSKYPRSPQK